MGLNEVKEQIRKINHQDWDKREVREGSGLGNVELDIKEVRRVKLGEACCWNRLVEGRQEFQWRQGNNRHETGA